MKRLAQKHLDDWLAGDNRKPLVVRGARQVGKTWLIRDLAQRHSLNLVELNFERRPGLVKHFSSNNIKNVLRDIEAEFNLKIIPSQSILFLDEIQAAPELLAFLRWFKEDLPELSVIAAGSLLEFVLQEHNFSMPVGRISYFHVEPMSFNEFILASGQEQLYERIINFNVKEPFNEALHHKCIEFYINYCFIGGLPEVVQTWVAKEDYAQCLKIQNDLLATYRDDFNKYREKVP
ncbi:MAG: AAA family ATPase, partial [Candidatus Omnitrophica bacterium]|nr:AAA family ATPase [Candidatus Omnitrophota bacterium]